MQGTQLTLYYPDMIFLRYCYYSVVASVNPYYPLLPSTHGQIAALLSALSALSAAQVHDSIKNQQQFLGQQQIFIINTNVSYSNIMQHHIYKAS